MTSHDVQLAVARAPVGARITFEEERLAYTVQARSKRFLVCTKPFNPQRTVLYSIIDLKRMVRGPENLIFGMGAETRASCERMLARLEGRAPPLGDPTEVSHRHCIPLRVARVRPPIGSSTPGSRAPRAETPHG